MAIAYERFEGEILADDDIISSASEDTQSLDQVQRQLVFGGPVDDGQSHGYNYQPIADNTGSPQAATADNTERLQRVHELLQNKWPQKIGVLHIVWGCILLLLGLAQLVVIPLAEDREDEHRYWRPTLDAKNCYGLTLWSALLLLLSGTLGVRAAIYRNTCNLYTFVTVIVLEVLIFVSFVLTILITFSSHGITQSSYPAGSVQFPVAVSAAVGVLLAFVFVLLAFTQYYDEVFCGELQLCRRCIHCCMPCLCPRAVSQEELLDDESPDRPPSLPV